MLTQMLTSFMSGYLIYSYSRYKPYLNALQVALGKSICYIFSIEVYLYIILVIFNGNIGFLQIYNY